MDNTNYRVRNGLLMFGRYKGYNIRNVHSDYLLWLIHKLKKLDSTSYRKVVELLESRGITVEERSEIPSYKKTYKPKPLKCLIPVEEANVIRAEMGLPPL